jgi:tol-pal system protein YbgF
MMRPLFLVVTAFLVVMVTGCMLAADAHAQMTEADLVTRLSRMEATIRDLTGRVEQLQYRNQQLEQQVQRLQQEEAGRETGTARPPAPSARSNSQYPQQTYAPPPANPPVASQVAPPIEVPPPGGRSRGDAFDPSANPNAPGVPRTLGSSTAANEPPPPVSDGPRQIGAPLDLSTPGGRPGELPPPPPINPNGTGAMQQATLPPSNSPRDQYDLAYGYVLRKDYPLAAESFRGFLRQYPSDHLAPEAQYWLGESLFQQQQYRDAAESFLAVSTKYEATARAPEALLRLGQSLGALGEKEAACASLGEVLRKYPHASAAVKQAVDREQKRGRC